MLILRGDSMLSGFPTTGDIPASCLAPHTVISEEKLTTPADVVRQIVPGSEVCALPGLTCSAVLQWFRATPVWWDKPTVFWFGRCEKPVNGLMVVGALAMMVREMKAPWWACAIPITPQEVELSRTGPVDEANAMIAEFEGDRFLDPIRAMGGNPVLPLDKRLDKFHPNSETNRALATWIVNQTIGRA